MRFQAIRGNLPREPFRWTLTSAGREFGIGEANLGMKLAQAKEQPGADGCYTTAQITKALWGDILEERFKKLKAETQKIELETAIMRGDFISRRELEASLGEIANGMIETIKASGQPKEQQDDLRRALASVPIVFREKAKAQGLNGAIKRKRGRPLKVKPDETPKDQTQG